MLSQLCDVAVTSQSAMPVGVQEEGDPGGPQARGMLRCPCMGVSESLPGLAAFSRWQPRAC